MPDDTYAFGSLAPPDELQPPPRNPAAPPDAIADAIRSALKSNIDWAKVPGLLARGVEPQTPGQWSEEDEFRKQHLAQQPYSWGPQTAFGEVFWPRTGTNVGGSGFAVGGGAMPPRSRDSIHAMFGLDSRSASTKQTDGVLKVIDDVLRSGTSGVPRVRDPGKPLPPKSIDDVLKAIDDALKLAPK